MHIESRRKLSFFSILLTYFVDNLGWSIVFPIFAPLFLNPDNSLFIKEISFSTRTTFLGLFLAVFPLAQFFGAPIMGEMADRSGRKNALVLSIILTLMGYLVTAFSIQNNSLLWMFFGRFISGVFSGNVSICLAVVSDLSPTEKIKVKNFGLLSILTGFSFMLGTYIGGKFSDQNILSFFNPAFPLWIASFLSVINFVFIYFGFKETYEIHKRVKYSFTEGFNNIYQALKTKNIKTIYVIYFLFIFGWTILFQFSPVLVINKFGFTSSQIGDVAAFMGICWAIGAGPINKLLSKSFSANKILSVALVVFAVLCSLVGFPNKIAYVISILGFCILIGGLGWPLCNAIISNKATQNIQGKIMGMSQSMQSLAMVVSSIVGGFADHISVYFPFLIAGFATFMAALMYFKVKF
ncbi:MAG: MFS transporter [Parachlamydiales bacterium]|jgi:DHA1 family tetracycline resistance protein-like MFS transporter